MRALLLAAALLAAASLVPVHAAAAPCEPHPDKPCCEPGEVAIWWRCVGPCDAGEIVVGRPVCNL
ncbi:MAG TPA: hypothetical protein VNX21_01895 [Candidatus Thermoplasmatota archaeon]|nr:hypothetical protein [Candidatus Thermoplasmatota archaeon]